MKTVRNIKEWSVRVIIKNCNLFKWLWLLWFLWGFAFTSTPSAPYFVGCWGCRDGFKGRKEAGWGRSKADLTTSEHVNPKIYRNDFMWGAKESAQHHRWAENGSKERRYESGFSPTVQGVTRVELFSIGTQKTIKRLESCSRERSEWGGDWDDGEWMKLLGTILTLLHTLRMNEVVERVYGATKHIQAAEIRFSIKIIFINLLSSFLRMESRSSQVVVVGAGLVERDKDRKWRGES